MFQRPGAGHAAASEDSHKDAVSLLRCNGITVLWRNIQRRGVSLPPHGTGLSSVLLGHMVSGQSHANNRRKPDMQPLLGGCADDFHGRPALQLKSSWRTSKVVADSHGGDMKNRSGPTSLACMDGWLRQRRKPGISFWQSAALATNPSKALGLPGKSAPSARCAPKRCERRLLIRGGEYCGARRAQRCGRLSAC